MARELRWRAELRGTLESAKRLRKPFYIESDQHIDNAMSVWLEAIYDAATAWG